MSEMTTIRYTIKCYKIWIILNFITFVVQAKHNYKVIVIERVVPRDMNYLALKYRPLGVAVPDLGTDEFWAPSLEDFRKWYTYPHVEFGPGTFKEEMIEREPNKIGKMFTVLLDLKKKREEQNKDINKGRELF